MSADDPARKAIQAVPERTLAARLRPLMPEIDRKVREGVRHEDLVAALVAEGLVVSLNTFRVNLFRYRQRAGAAPARMEPAGPSSAVLAEAPGPEMPEEGRRVAAVEEAPVDATRALSEALDPRKRAEAADKYLTQPRRPLLRPKQQG